MSTTHHGRAFVAMCRESEKFGCAAPAAGTGDRSAAAADHTDVVLGMHRHGVDSDKLRWALWPHGPHNEGALNITISVPQTWLGEVSDGTLLLPRAYHNGGLAAALGLATWGRSRAELRSPVCSVGAARLRPYLNSTSGQRKPWDGGCVVADDRLTKWTRWIDDVTEDLYDLWYDEVRWRQLHEVANDNAGIPNAEDFLVWIDNLYLQAVALGVRRQSEVRNDSISLGRLLDEVAKYPATMQTAPWYPAIVAGSVLPADVGHAELAIAASEDASRLGEAATSVVRFVNKSVAHRARGKARVGVQLDPSAVNGAMTLLRTILARYTFALKGIISLSGPLPDYDWLQALTVAWTTPQQIVEYFNRDYAENE
jgi:hypothetical protein